MSGHDFTSELAVPASYKPPQKEPCVTKKKQPNPLTVRLTKENRVRLESIHTILKLDNRNLTFNWLVEHGMEFLVLKPRMDAWKVAMGGEK
jgi:hypothetical protein